MEKIYSVLALSLLVTACQKKPDPPAPDVASTTTTTTNPPSNPPANPPPPPVTNCQNATVLYSLPGGQNVNDNSQRSFVVTGFEISCGDTLNVYFRAAGITPAPAWIQLHDVNNGASYYSITNQTVTIFNKTGIIMEADIEAVLK